MSVTNDSYDATVERSYNAVDNSAEDGDGGGTMAVWKQSRVNLLRDVAGGNFNNNSSFDVPPGFIDSVNNYDTTWSNSEKMCGVNARGTVVGPEGKPQQGTSRMLSGESTVTSKTSSGSFILSAHPPAGVSSGSSESASSYDYEFAPSNDGLNVSAENIGVSYDAGLVQYGSITGQVTDYHGNVVSDVRVSGSGNATKTDGNGVYSLLAPGNTTVSLNAIGTTTNYTPPAGQKITADWQYSRLQVRVITSDLDPVEGVKVTINGVGYQTDANGEVTIDTAPLKQYDIDVAGGGSDSVDITTQGSENVSEFGKTHAGARLILTEAATGRDVGGVPVSFSNGLSAVSGAGGKAAVTTPDAAETTVTVDPVGERYKTVDVDVSLTDGETVEKTVELEKDVTIGGN
jgi:hypothetical protein